MNCCVGIISTWESFCSWARRGSAKRVGAGPVMWTRPRARTLVAWTLGNFVFPSSGETARTAILEVRLDRTGVRGYRLLPVRIDGFRPQLVQP